MKKVFPPLALSVVVCIALQISSSFLSAYEVKPVTNGGVIRGTVTLKGKAPARATLKVTKDHAVCGQQVPDQTLMVKQHRIQNVVVSIEGISAGKAPGSDKPHLSNVRCHFVPHVQTAQVGTRLEIENADDVLHNTHGTYEDGVTAFNLALPIPHQKIKARIKKSGIIAMNCDAGHTWMSAYVVAFEHPYHAVTGEDGSFTISDIPPGTYTLSIWHEKLRSKTMPITVAAGKTENVSIELEGQQ